MELNRAGRNWLTGKIVSIPNRDFDELELDQFTRRIAVIKNVSIPNRDFDELEPGVDDTSEEILLFQSLIGILMNWNCHSMLFIVIATQFQSLIGILMNWNYSGTCSTEPQFQFQSLIGILMNWNPPPPPPSVPGIKGVSIPNRDFDELERDAEANCLVQTGGFNP